MKRQMHIKISRLIDIGIRIGIRYTNIIYNILVRNRSIIRLIIIYAAYSFMNPKVQLEVLS